MLPNYHYTELQLTNTGKSETETDMLRSILAEMEYSFQINKWDREGVPFRTHVHVPEQHPVTKTLFCEREDEGHVFKVSIAQCLLIVLLLTCVENCK